MQDTAPVRRALKSMFIVALVVASVLVALELHQELTPVPGSDEPVIVSVPPGATTRQIGLILQEAGLVKHAWMFRLVVEMKGQDGKLRAGEYELRPGITMAQIVEKLLRGHVVTYPLTVPEGLTVEQIATLVEQRGLGSREKFLEAARNPELVREFLPEDAECREPLEGYLFPDTYLFPRHVTEEFMVRAMVSRFNQVFSEEWRRRATDLGFSAHQMATLASIIEREAVVADERPIISGVYHNRLKVGMRLQADPTVLYALGRSSGAVRFRDLEVDSPYNTYRYAGLPPGPIANFGVAALRAALFPADVPYYYFVARNDGTHAFAVTYQQHLANIAKYQR